MNTLSDHSRVEILATLEHYRSHIIIYIILYRKLEKLLVVRKPKTMQPSESRESLVKESRLVNC